MLRGSCFIDTCIRGVTEPLKIAWRRTECRLKRMLIEEQLQYKILVSWERNDVSSGLKWIVLGNSVVLMPPPTRTSCAMEEFLQPFVHFEPMAEDRLDAKEKVKWPVGPR